jgi:hypothetical protein
MVPVPATADTGRAMVPGTVTGTESRTRTGLGVQNLDPVSIPVSPAHADGSGETGHPAHVQDQLGDRGPNRQGSTNSSPQALVPDAERRSDEMLDVRKNKSALPWIITQGNP